MKNNLKEIIFIICLIVVMVLLLNPMQIWMPDMLVMCMLVAVFVIFVVYAIFILREKNFDERDGQHRTLAGQNAFLAGSAVAIIGIIVQGYQHSIDSWLVGVLIVMILTKVFTRIWSDKNL